MFKGHPLTFHSHRPLCDLLLSAKVFEEHSNPQLWGGSKGGSKRETGERQKEAKESKEKGKAGNDNDKRCALLTDSRQMKTEPGGCYLRKQAGWDEVMGRRGRRWERRHGGEGGERRRGK